MGIQSYQIFLQRNIWTHLKHLIGAGRGKKMLIGQRNAGIVQGEFWNNLLHITHHSDPIMKTTKRTMTLVYEWKSTPFNIWSQCKINDKLDCDSRSGYYLLSRSVGFMMTSCHQMWFKKTGLFRSCSAHLWPAGGSVLDQKSWSVCPRLTPPRFISQLQFECIPIQTGLAVAP